MTPEAEAAEGRHPQMFSGRWYLPTMSWPLKLDGMRPRSTRTSPLSEYAGRRLDRGLAPDDIPTIVA